MNSITLRGRLLPALFLTVAWPAAQAAQALPVSTTTELEEVQVIGRRLFQMRQDAVKAEDRFYAAFNALNRSGGTAASA